MAFTRPTLAELVDRVQADFVSRLDLAGAVLRRSIVYVLARVIAGTSHMLHGHLDWVVRQVFPDTADADYLLRWGSLFGVTATPAAFASGNLTLTGSDGNTVAAGAVLRRADGAEYTTQADATIASGTATVAVLAAVAAQAGNCDAGVQLTFESPVAGVDATATVAVGGLSGGADPEDIEAYRLRVIARMQSPPHGGDTADYVGWALEVAGVTRAWVVRYGMGIGTVLVYFMRDDDSGSPIPDAGEVATVQAYIDARRPVTATLTVAAPVADPLNFTLHVEPNTTAVKAAVSAELADLLRRETTPSATLLLSSIRTAIGIAEGLTDYTLTSPAADVTHATGHIATLGTVTYV